MTHMSNEKQVAARQEDRLRQTMQREADELAAALEVAADSLRSATWAAQARAEGVRAMVDVDADDALRAIADARAALDHHGARLGALAAMGGYPLGRVGEALGLTGTGTAIRLAQTDLLAGIARGQRVTRRDLAMAYAQLPEPTTK